MKNNEIAIVCKLTDPEFRERERTVLQQIKDAVLEFDRDGKWLCLRFPVR
ncbi:MAG: hypothetical protein AB7F88_00510 [Pyrinomonadaceae bacterium]